MKFATIISTAALALLLKGGTANASLRSNSSGQRHQLNTTHRRVLEEDQVGIFVLKTDEGAPSRLRKLQGGKPLMHTFSVNFPDGTFFEIKNAPPGWTKKMVSGATPISIPKGVIFSGTNIDMKGKAPKPVDQDLFDRLLEEQASRTPDQERNLAELKKQQRELAVVTGQKSVLAVKVNHVGVGNLGKYSMSNYDIADSIFGSKIGGPDLVNLSSQYFACSHGKLDFVPAGNRGGNGLAETVVGHVSSISNGVVTVTVDGDCTGTCDGVLRNAVNSALSSEFGSISSQYDHVMHCMPPGAMSGIAYAYINSWNSVYSAQWCTFPSGQMHEIGHNLNLAHSGELSNQYDDRSGFMGYSYSSDEQKMCFNNAKNSQLGWFTGSEVEVGISGGYTGKLLGQVNYDGTLNNGAVVVKVQDPDSPNAFYIGFNHKVKHNANSNEAGNLVTIQQYNRGTGSGYGASLLIGKIGTSSGVWSQSLGPNTVTVEVKAIDTSADTGYADVVISYGVVTPNPTPVPTVLPTPGPTKAPAPPTPEPSKAPSTSPTTAQPTTSPTTAEPTPSPSKAPSKSPTLKPTASPTPFSCTNFNQGNCPAPQCEWIGRNVKECRDAAGNPPAPTPTPPSPTAPTGSPPTSCVSSGSCTKKECDACCTVVGKGQSKQCAP